MLLFLALLHDLDNDLPEISPAALQYNFTEVLDLCPNQHTMHRCAMPYGTGTGTGTGTQAHQSPCQHTHRLDCTHTHLTSRHTSAPLRSRALCVRVASLVPHAAIFGFVQMKTLVPSGIVPIHSGISSQIMLTSVFGEGQK